MKIQEASEDLQMGGILFLSPDASNLKMKTLNDGKSENLGQGRDFKRLAHEGCAL